MLAAGMEFRKVNAPPALLLRTVERQRFRHAAHVHVVKIAVLANEIENDAFGPRVAKPLQLRVLGVIGGFIEDRIEQELALLESSTWQPLDLQEEFRAEAAQDLFGLGLVTFEEQRGQYPLAPGLVVAIVLAERLVHGGAEMVAQLIEFGPQLVGRQLLVSDARKLSRPEPPQVGGEEIHLRSPQPIARDRVVGDFLQVPGEAGVVQLAQVFEFLAGEPPRPGQPVVEVNGQPVDAHLRAEHQPLLALARFGNRAQPPALSTVLDGVPNPPVRDGEKLDLLFGYQALQQFVRGKGQIHALRDWPDQDMIGLEDEVHRLERKAFLFFQAERRQGLCRAIFIDALNETQPLQRMHPGQFGPKCAVSREQGANPGDQFQLHSALTFNYWINRRHPFPKGQSKAAAGGEADGDYVPSKGFAQGQFIALKSLVFLVATFAPLRNAIAASRPSTRLGLPLPFLRASPARRAPVS